MAAGHRREETTRESCRRETRSVFDLETTEDTNFGVSSMWSLKKLLHFVKTSFFLRKITLLRSKPAVSSGETGIFGKSLEMPLEAFPRSGELEMISFAPPPVDVNVLVDKSLLEVPAVSSQRRWNTTRNTMDLRRLKLLLIF